MCKSKSAIAEKGMKMNISSTSNDHQNFKAIIKLSTGRMLNQGEMVAKEFNKFSINSKGIETIISTDGIFKDDKGNSISSTTIIYNTDPGTIHFEMDGTLATLGSNKRIIFDIPRKYEEIIQILSNAKETDMVEF